MNLLTLVGLLASLASTTSFVPQIWKIVRSGDTAALSEPMYLLTVAGFALWLTYGLLLGQWPLILTNGICLLLAGFILTIKLLPHRAKPAIVRPLVP